MKPYLKFVIILGVVIQFLSMVVCADEKNDAGSLKAADLEQRISYALGYDIVDKLQKNFQFDPAFFKTGIKDAQKGTPALSREEIEQLINEYRRIAQKAHQEALLRIAKENRERGSRFMADNITKQGIKNLPSGLQYRVLIQGNGPKPDPGDTVECHYRGKLLDGTEFDSSYKRGKPSAFQIEDVIPGWQQALVQMPVGSKWMLFIPPDLAYGDGGAGELIPPGATLVFEIHLVSIVR